VGIESLDGVPVAATLRPASAQEVAATLFEARGRGAALAPTGGGSKLHWGNRSDAEKLDRLDLRGLDAPLDVDADEGIATVGAGVAVAALEQRAHEAGKRTRLPRLYPDATVGGTIASDPVGPDTVPEHRLRDELLGLEVALTNGELTRSGGQVVKNVTGFDLVRLYCGSQGTLGVITRATLRLWPLPESRSVRVRDSSDVQSAIATAQEILASGVEPAGIAILPDESRAKLLWCVEGSKVDAEERAARVEGERADESEWSEASVAVAGVEPAPGRCMVRLSGRQSDTGPVARCLAEAGGVLRAVLPALGIAWADVEAPALPALEERTRACDFALFTERGDAELKRERDVYVPEPGGLPLMRTLKSRFDPERVLNPGRFVGRI
jgi:glycolate oxidase FAD binding subunit